MMYPEEYAAVMSVAEQLYAEIAEVLQKKPWNNRSYALQRPMFDTDEWNGTESASACIRVETRDFEGSQRLLQEMEEIADKYTSEEIYVYSSESRQTAPERLQYLHLTATMFL